MTVKMLVSTRLNGVFCRAGSVANVPAEVGARWVKNRIAAVAEPSAPPNTEKPPEKMTVPELEALAATLGVDLANAKLKDEKLALVLAALKADGAKE